MSETRMKSMSLINRQSRGRRQPRLGRTVSRVVVTLALCAALHASGAAARSTRGRRLAEIQGCQPNALPREERCEFVRTHPSCRPEDGWIPYLEVHYCYLNQMELASTAVFLLWIAVLFGLMLMVAERFFCPSLELISEYLRLPPCVAGATLLSFGNGAPDVFTQLAAISQGDSDSSSPGAVAMALSEPLGSGLFVGNIVFALVVFFSGLNEVKVQRSYFLKDCLFYLAGVVTVFAVLIHGVVMVWEVALLAGYYLLFIVATIVLSRGDEPVHADPRLHEVPHRLRPLDSFFRESFRRVRDFSSHASHASHASQASDTDNDAEAPLLAAASPRPYMTQPKQAQPGPPPPLQRGPTLERIDESSAAAAPSGAELTEGADVDVEYDDGDDDDLDLDLELLARMRSAASAAAGSSSGSGATYRRPDGGGAGGGGYKPPPPVLAAAPPLPFHAAGRTLSADSAQYGGSRTGSGWPPAAAGRGGGSLEAAPSSLRRQDSGKPPGRMEVLWRRLERPGLALLSVFMPRVAVDTHARYRKTCAVLLPPVLPTVVGWAQGWLDGSSAPGGFWLQRWWQVATGVGLLVAAAALRFYPRKGHLHGYAAGVATVVVFCEAMLLLDGSAGELVSAAVALGQIYGISPSLLGATLLAWGNSVSDLVSNITLAKDGLPSMAITACFASPMFVLLAGLVTSLTYATRHGDMQLPHDLALRVLYGCSCSILLMWALVVPFVFRFRLTRRVGVLAVLVYAAYQTVYIWAVVHDSRR
ncbi:hypothetical protein PLESTM_001231900 [Pleodorina starrii]|nr:hypothetical protein PLESTM_001231900 [Pleodorina starrii]